jgi:hypothetical protein
MRCPSIVPSVSRPSRALPPPAILFLAVAGCLAGACPQRAARASEFSAAGGAATVVPLPEADEASSLNVVLEDQFRNRRGTAELRGDVVVLVYAERRGAEAANTLGRRLHVRFHPTAETAPPADWTKQPVVGLPGWPADARVPDVHVVPVACVAEVPRPLHGIVRMRIRQESPHIPVWLDFDDSLRKQFGIVPGEPNITLIDTEGRPQGVSAGNVNDSQFEALVAAIDRLRLASGTAVRLGSVPTQASGVMPVNVIR